MAFAPASKWDPAMAASKMVVIALQTWVVAGGVAGGFETAKQGSDNDALLGARVGSANGNNKR